MLGWPGYWCTHGAHASNVPAWTQLRWGVSWMLLLSDHQSYPTWGHQWYVSTKPKNHIESSVNLSEHVKNAGIFSILSSFFGRRFFENRWRVALWSVNFSCFARRKRSGRRRFRRTTRPAAKETQRGRMEDSKQRIIMCIVYVDITWYNPWDVRRRTLEKSTEKIHILLISINHIQ